MFLVLLILGLDRFARATKVMMMIDGLNYLTVSIFSSLSLNYLKNSRLGEEIASVKYINKLISIAHHFIVRLLTIKQPYQNHFKIC